jgi:hypothetical protein
MDKESKLQVVVETPEYIKRAEACMDEQSRDGFIDFIAKSPSAGAVIVGTGGARKVRWTSDSNQGKRGGARIIYYYHDTSIPIFLFTAYGKNVKGNLLKAERNALQIIIKKIVKTYGG